LLTLVTETNVTKTEETLSLDGEQIPCEVYTCRPEADQLRQVLAALSVQLEADEAMAALLWEEWSLGGQYFYTLGDGLLTPEEYPQWYEGIVDQLQAVITEELVAEECQWSIFVNRDRIHKLRLVWKEGYALEYETAGRWTNGRYDALRWIQDGVEKVNMLSRIVANGIQASGELMAREAGRQKIDTLRFVVELEDYHKLGILEGVAEFVGEIGTIRVDTSEHTQEEWKSLIFEWVYKRIGEHK
ncbi:MAG: hypothetical protein J6I64_00290, partial [Lachnospiraceae bacterium]|nr:hypothetical protein [Lachnospiraceae bacterium]